ncbi:hypothetical protein B9Z55_007224 [Caenorhabditis nigoni]|uniref:Homeobox domain-containing protein n=1 Tax=Caenorhabditis nigoni TaxID=1611254 RepID=A0A2G5V8M2_9PELO|nr:hypothetical protein B9Z55_007224 [Caenorhabditis nigoni]
MPIRRVEKPSKETTSRDQKRRRQPSSESESDDNVQIVKRRPGRPRKSSISQGTSQVSAQKSRPSNNPVSQDDDLESRPRRKSARCVTYQESDSDFDDSPIQKKTERRTVDSKKDALSSSSSSADSSSSELDFPIGDSDSEEETENEQEEEATQKTCTKPGGTRKAIDESRRKRTKYTEEQTKILQAALRETINPSFEQRIKLAEETNLSLVQVRKWINNNRQENPEWLKARESNPEWLKRREGILSGDKKQRMEQVFATNRRPDKETIASLVSELGITKEKVKGWFSTKRYRNPVPEETPVLLCEEDARPILMEYFEKNPRFRDYKNPELKEKTGWPRHRLREFFESCRKEHGTVDSALPHEKADPILMDIFLKDPLFSDFKNVELKQKIQWSSRKIEEWFRRQRHLKKENQFRNAMEMFFETCQFLEKRNKALELESGGAWRRISKWMKNKRKNVLESFLKKEITVNEMPNEMATFERLCEKYDGPNHEDLILYIEKKEKVNGDMFAVYLVERWTIVGKLNPEDVQEEEEGDSDDPLEGEYVNDSDIDYHENEREDVQRTEQHEEDEMESEGYEIGTPDSSLLDEDDEDTPLSDNAPIVNHIENEFDDFGNETKNVPRFVPATVYRDQSQDVEEKHHI